MTYTPQQRAGIQALREAGGRLKLPPAHIAYVLATAWHETGQEMVPNRENLNYSVEGLLGKFSRVRISEADARRLGRKPNEPALGIERQRAIGNVLYGGIWGRANLGNTEPDDGWHFRGGGYDHCTGRRNFRAVADASGLGDVLMVNPDLILRAPLAATAIVTGMIVGRYTGVRLRDRLPTTGLATWDQFKSARPIINGTDRAADIANYAMDFQNGK